MKFVQYYLSSYKFGSNFSDFSDLLQNKDSIKLAYIPNAGDPYVDLTTRSHDKIRIDEMSTLFIENHVSVEIELLDLRHYFDRQEQLRKDIISFDVLWVKGGNVYVLREAMRRSGCDEILRELHHENTNLVYAGYSAGVCVLAENLEGIHLMDDLTQEIYGPLSPSTPGIGILPYLVIPHFESPGHPETELADVCISYMQENQLPYRKLRDGEVIIIDETGYTLFK